MSLRILFLFFNIVMCSSPPFAWAEPGADPPKPPAANAGEKSDLTDWAPSKPSEELLKMVGKVVVEQLQAEGAIRADGHDPETQADFDSLVREMRERDQQFIVRIEDLRQLVRYEQQKAEQCNAAKGKQETWGYDLQKIDFIRKNTH